MVFSFLTWTASVWGSLGYTAMACAGVFSLIRALLFFSVPYALLTRTGLPTMVASMAWKQSEHGLRRLSWATFFLPLTAAAVFVARVATWADASYALYWVAVPVVVALLPQATRRTVLARSMVCSMVAHMVGSLIVLFSGMSIAWAALVPVVLFERIVAAVGMASMAYLFNSLRAIAGRVRSA